jgi:hypothetical protein
MVFKGIENLTGKELCEIEGMIFPYIAKMNENDPMEVKKDATIEIAITHGEKIAYICYTDDKGNPLTDDTIEPYRMRVMEEVFPEVMIKLFGGDSDKGKPKPTAKRIPKR